MMSVIQPVGAQEHHSSASDFARLYVGSVEPQYQLLLWHDIPYYKDNTDLYAGRVSYHGVVYDDVQLRFDQFMQRIAVLTPVGNYLCLPEKKYIDWFEMDGHRYVQDPEDHAMRTCFAMGAPTASGFIIVCGRLTMVTCILVPGNC